MPNFVKSDNCGKKQRVTQLHVKGQAAKIIMYCTLVYTVQLATHLHIENVVEWAGQVLQAELSLARMEDTRAHRHLQADGLENQESCYSSTWRGEGGGGGGEGLQ